MTLEEKILLLESQSEVLEPTEKVRNQWMSQISAYAGKFIDKLPTDKAFIEDYNSKNLFHDMDYTETKSMSEILHFLESEVDSIGLNPASGGHVGYIPGGGIYPTAMGDYLAAITNRYAGMFFGGPGAVRMENSLIQWLCKIMGFPSSAHGNLCSGGSIANLIAITTARDKKGITSKKVTEAVVYLTAQTHHCVQKALRIAGLAECEMRYISMDKNHSMQADALESQIAQDKANGLIPFLIVASAGTTDAGAIDPLDSIADLATTNNCWFHVDAAYGGFFILVDALKSRFKGIEKADSLAIDPHKGLFLSYGLGVVLIKDVKAMYDSHFYKAGYMQDAQERFDEVSPADISPELTKHFRGLRLWLSLRLFGLDPFIKSLEEKHLLAAYFHKEVQKLGFEVGPEPALSVVLYRYNTTSYDKNNFNALLVKELHKDGRVFLSSTNLDGESWMRAAILSFRTHKSTMDTCLEMLHDCVERVKLSLQ